MFASIVRGAANAARNASAAVRTLSRRFRRNASGNVAMMFALVAIPLTGAVGLAIDMGRTYHVAMHTQGALDAAALAAGRIAQVEKSDTLNKASKAASAYFDQAKPTDVVETKIAFAPNTQQTAFTVTATSWVKTPFLSVLNLFNPRSSAEDAPTACKGNYYGCSKVVSTATAEICLNCSDVGGGNADDGTNLEIAMMLDLTGSMAGDKIVDLQAAAKDLVDIVVWGDQSKYTSKVALAPFAPAVNVGEYFTKITGKSDREDNDGSSSKNIHYPPECINAKGNVKSSCSSNSTYNTPPYIAKFAKCVVERTNVLYQFTDTAPTATDKNTFLPTWNEVSNSGKGSMATTCNPSVAILPLTSDRTKLKNTIDGFTASGTTAGQLGTAFAWYLLSPNWANVWPVESRPAPYGTPKLKKIAILMTDGEYNTLQGTQYSDGSAQATTALTQAKTLCTAMKKNLLPGDPGIEVYTVGFKLDTAASKAMLKNCASSAGHYYETTSGDGLKAAFRDIALKISRLRLTN
jgi:Flp pilus assembly protein TadG